MLDLRPPIASALVAFGVDAVVTPPEETPVETTVVWLAPETVAVGGDYQRAELRRVVALLSADVPEVPRGTIISAAEVKGGTVLDWKVDAAQRLDYDHHRATVVPA